MHPFYYVLFVKSYNPLQFNVHAASFIRFTCIANDPPKQEVISHPDISFLNTRVHTCVCIQYSSLLSFIELNS